MKIGLAIHGGLAAGIRLGRPARTLDADALPETEKSKLRELIAAAKREAASGASKGPRGADNQSYTISVADGDEPLELTQYDATMSPAFAALRNWIQDHLRGKN